MEGKTLHKCLACDSKDLVFGYLGGTAMPLRISTALWTGVFYLGLAVTGLVGFLFVRGEMFVADDSASTLANLMEQSSLARVGIAADLSIVLFQALAAMWRMT